MRRDTFDRLTVLEIGGEFAAGIPFPTLGPRGQVPLFFGTTNQPVARGSIFGPTLRNDIASPLQCSSYGGRERMFPVLSCTSVVLFVLFIIFPLTFGLILV